MLRGARTRQLGWQGVRIGLLVVIVLLIHGQHRRRAERQAGQGVLAVDLAETRDLFPQAARLGTDVDRRGRRAVYADDGRPLGHVLQTSPYTDHIIGFSGPTNVLVGLDPQQRIVGLKILSSGDTREHVGQVRDARQFLRAWEGLAWEDAGQPLTVEGVTGATLTSRAIQAAIAQRFGGSPAAWRFPEPPAMDGVRTLFANAVALRQDAADPSLWYVLGRQQETVGAVLRTSPAADQIMGYQGPTDTWIGLDSSDRIVGLVIGPSFDNQPYVGYVRDDTYFLTLFNDMLLSDLAQVDLAQMQVEGVSGATMTSMAVARGLVRAAAERQRRAEHQTRSVPIVGVRLRDIGTLVVVLWGTVLGVTRWRASRRHRRILQLVVIVYLGLLQGDMVSQAMLVGWAQHGVPWTAAAGLVGLTLAAFLVPMATGHNVYCHQICPHGAVQQLLRKRIPARVRVSPRVAPWLRSIPVGLLLWCLIVAMTGWSFSLVDIEPFDAWVWRVAGWATITVAAVGLVAATMVPMAYCKYGCPTGALLGYVRRHARSDRWGRRDWLALLFVALAVALFR